MADIRANESQVQGTRPHDEAEAAGPDDNPVKIGGKAATSRPAAVAAGDRVDGYYDEYGQLVTRFGAGEPVLTAASISVNSSGNNTLVSGTGGQTIRVYRLILVFAAAVNVYFRDGAAGAAMTGTMTMKEGGSIVLDHTGEPWFKTTAAENFVLNLSAGVQASGRIWYVKGA